MAHGDEIDFFQEVREAAGRRLGECEHEAGLAGDLSQRSTDPDGDADRRRRKLLSRAERYRSLIARLEVEATGVSRSRFRSIADEDRPALLARARKLHHRARRLAAALERTQEQYRGLQMRHLALAREHRELASRLGRQESPLDEPAEIRLSLGKYAPTGDA
jgi:hypothetical protein